MDDAQSRFSMNSGLHSSLDIGLLKASAPYLDLDQVVAWPDRTKGFIPSRTPPIHNDA